MAGLRELFAFHDLAFLSRVTQPDGEAAVHEKLCRPIASFKNRVERSRYHTSSAEALR